MKRILSVLLVLLTATPEAKAVSEAAVLFLLIQPSPRATGMAGASVATGHHTPLAMANNPAHVGLAALGKRTIGFEFYPAKTDWLPGFNIKGITYNAKAFVAGFDLRRFEHKLPISFGFAYTQIDLNLGEQIITDETSPEPIGSFSSSENAQIWSVGIALDYTIKAGFGFNFKNIESNLPSIGIGSELGSGSASSNAYDFGVLLQVPVLEIVSKAIKKPVTLANNFQPFFMTGFGFSKSNIGDEISYIDAAQKDPLPRVARVGASLNAGLVYENKNGRISILSYEWLTEAEDLLVKRDALGQFSYESGAGKIAFVDNVLRSRANSNIITGRGWELSLFDIISIRRGTYKDPDGNVFYDTSGLGVSFVNMLRLAGLLQAESFTSEILDFLRNHVDIQYDQSSLDAAAGTPLDGTTSKGITISLF